MNQDPAQYYDREAKHDAHLSQEKINHDLATVAGVPLVNAQEASVATLEYNETACQVPEISAELAATYETKDPNIRYMFGCGDDRELTDESLEALIESGSPDTEAYQRYYGAVEGAARVTAVAIAAQYPEAFANYKGTFVDFIGDFKQRAENANKKVRFALHSAASNEGNPRSFNPDAPTGLGCAHAAGAGAVANICANSAAHKELSAIEQPQMFGSDDLLDMVSGANDAFGRKFYGEEYATAGVTRDDYSTLNMPVQILAGAHAPVRKTRVVVNFHVDKISNPSAAIDAGLPAYNNDVTQLAEIIMRTYPELKLDPEILLAVMDQDIRATRAALASHDAEPNTTAADLVVERYGDPQEATNYLRALQETL